MAHVKKPITSKTGCQHSFIRDTRIPKLCDNIITHIYNYLKKRG